MGTSCSVNDDALHVDPRKVSSNSTTTSKKTPSTPTNSNVELHQWIRTAALHHRPPNGATDGGGTPRSFNYNANFQATVDRLKRQRVQQRRPHDEASQVLSPEGATTAPPQHPTTISVANHTPQNANVRNSLNGEGGDAPTMISIVAQSTSDNISSIVLHPISGTLSSDQSSDKSIQIFVSPAPTGNPSTSRQELSVHEEHHEFSNPLWCGSTDAPRRHGLNAI